jgi:hypothetical protein
MPHRNPTFAAITFTIGMLVTGGALSVQADSSTPPLPAQVPAHNCQMPARPADLHDHARWNRFVDDVDAYRACMNAFIEHSRSLARAHQDAAASTAEEWNAFVRSSLNVPEHFPWPPPER